MIMIIIANLKCKEIKTRQDYGAYGYYYRYLYSVAIFVLISKNIIRVWGYFFLTPPIIVIEESTRVLRKFPPYYQYFFFSRDMEGN
jgi:hypothetical protein